MTKEYVARQSIHRRNPKTGAGENIKTGAIFEPTAEEIEQLTTGDFEHRPAIEKAKESDIALAKEKGLFPTARPTRIRSRRELRAIKDAEDARQIGIQQNKTLASQRKGAGEAPAENDDDPEFQPDKAGEGQDSNPSERTSTGASTANAGKGKEANKTSGGKGVRKLI